LLKAVIFDIDGTLVDSVDLHARAWQEAFAHFGHQVEFSAVRSQIGKGGDQLMPVFLSKEEIDSQGQEIEEYRSKLYKQQYLSKVHAFPEVRQLIERIKGNGLQVVLASSAKSDELQTYKQIAGIEDLIDEETSADDAAKSKPHPDIFKAALVLQPCFKGSSPFPVAFPGPLLVAAAPARPGAGGLMIRWSGPDQMPQQAAQFGHGERQEIGREIDGAFFPRRQCSEARQDRHAPASPA
jgi:hypothetical protein